MTTINTIEDLVRILREQPAWAEAVRSVLLSDDLLDLPARFDRFVQSQEETNRYLSEMLSQQSELLAKQSELLTELKEISEDNRQRLNSLESRANRTEGRLGNLEGGQYERNIRAKALARCQLRYGFQGVYYALTQDGIADSRLLSAVGHALNEGLVSTADIGNLYEADLIISDENNRHAVFEVSITADDHDIQRAKQRADSLHAVTGGSTIPVVITARIDDTYHAQAEEEGVSVFVVPYP